jgi:hypothetical protein
MVGPHFDGAIVGEVYMIFRFLEPWFLCESRFTKDHGAGACLVQTMALEWLFVRVYVCYVVCILSSFFSLILTSNKTLSYVVALIL